MIQEEWYYAIAVDPTSVREADTAYTVTVHRFPSRFERDAYTKIANRGGSGINAYVSTSSYYVVRHAVKQAEQGETWPILVTIDPGNPR